MPTPRGCDDVVWIPTYGVGQITILTAYDDEFDQARRKRQPLGFAPSRPRLILPQARRQRTNGLR